MEKDDDKILRCDGVHKILYFSILIPVQVYIIGHLIEDL